MRFLLKTSPGRHRPCRPLRPEAPPRPRRRRCCEGNAPAMRGSPTRS